MIAPNFKAEKCTGVRAEVADADTWAPPPPPSPPQPPQHGRGRAAAAAAVGPARSRGCWHWGGSAGGAGPPPPPLPQPLQSPTVAGVARPRWKRWLGLAASSFITCGPGGVGQPGNVLSG